MNTSINISETIPCSDMNYTSLVESRKSNYFKISHLGTHFENIKKILNKHVYDIDSKPGVATYLEGEWRKYRE